MILKKGILFLINLIIVNCLFAQDYKALLQQQHSQNQPLFEIKNPDFKTSPITGMTKNHWYDAAKYLLNGAFSYIHSLDDPMQFPKQEGKSYPRNSEGVVTEKLEGLCRTLFIAAPLLKHDSNIVINRIKVADYYRHQLRQLINPQSDLYIKTRQEANINWPSQTLVELGALSISLFVIPEILWEPLSQQDKDALAKLLNSYGDGPTVPSNWKFFNIFTLSFVKSKGYSINEKTLIDYLDKSLEHYVGDGWYNDNPAFDYYSMWAFQMYGKLWSHFYGKNNYPEYAKKFEINFNELKPNYPHLFSKNGEMIMWGRSISYRFGSIVPFPLMGLDASPNLNYGWLRRISSGVILQFLQNKNFLENNVPTLGFYGAFEPAVQSYSCRGSAFWLGKAFLGLIVPDDNPFWTAKENNGDWNSQYKKNKVYNYFSEGSKILTTNYPEIGASELRAWCHVKAIGARESFRASENYNRLSYNSAFPWQADSVKGVIAMNYIVKNKKEEWEPFRLFTFKKYENDVYFRDVYLETDSSVKFQLADLTLPNGILRLDINQSTVPVNMRLGHYALPDLGKGIKEITRKVNGYNVTIIDNGKYQLAMIPLQGWTQAIVQSAENVHPAAKYSKVINVTYEGINNKNPLLFATLMLWKKSGEKWKNDELIPIKKLNYNKQLNKVTLQFTNNSVKTIQY